MAYTALDEVEGWVRAELAHAKLGTWEAACVWTTCVVQARVRGHREVQRVEDGAGFTTWPPAILGLGSGYCGSAVVAWQAILQRLGVTTRQIGFRLTNDTTHVGGEAHYDNAWHFYDVQRGAFWRRNGVVLPIDEIMGLPDHHKYLVANELWTEMSGWANPYDYISRDTTWAVQ